MLLTFCLLLLGGGMYLHRFSQNVGPLAKERVIKALSDRFNADVTLQSLQVSLFPQPSVVGEGLAIRHKQWPDQHPLIWIRRFYARTSFLTLANRSNYVSLVRLEGLAIRIPPRGRAALAHSLEANGGVEGAEVGRDTTQFQFLIETIVADGTLLEILPKVEGKEPLQFDIQKLTMRPVGPMRPMAFTAKLINAKPPGLIDTTGSFGPWQKDDPGATPVSGDYNFKNADLSVFSGISGILSSTGKYDGVLQQIDVKGTTDTPTFALTRGGEPVHLTTTFHSIVDGINGDTILDPVDAKFGNSEFICRGGATQQKGPKGKTVSLDARTTHARMEDILLLIVGDKPLLTGDVDFRSKIVIPPGKEDMLDKLGLAGQFRLLEARFTSEKVEQRLRTLSDRARGISKSEEEEGKGVHGNVASDLAGAFKLDKGVTSFSRLSFSVPGALIRLAGNYNLRTGQIDMRGVFRMQATLSDTQSGMKHLLLKPVDPLFKKDGAGFEVPITIAGTRDHPSIEADAFHKHFTIH